MTQLSVHDASPSLWHALDVDVRGGESTYWKVLDTPSIRIVIFEPHELLEQRGLGRG